MAKRRKLAHLVAIRLRYVLHNVVRHVSEDRIMYILAKDLMSVGYI